MSINRKNILIIVSVLMTIFIISGSTFAYWKWRSNEASKTNITLTTAMNFSCSADGGGNITEQDATLIPTYCTNSPYVIKREITTNVINNGSTNVYLDLWLKVNSISHELSDSQYFSYALTDSPDGCTSGHVLSNGTFTGAYAGTTFDMLTNDTYANSALRTYYLYIWLDVEETNNDTQNQQFNIELQGECSTTNDSGLKRKPNPPQLVDGLIPVKLSDTGATVTTTSIDDSSWYDYDEKKWANAILVSEDTHTREYYLNNPGTTVPISDILAYYVWIPRYSYKVWLYSGVSERGQEQEIEIKYVDGGTIENATQNGEWYTHPAFWWDDDSDGVRESGEELSGIWVGKFETSHNTLSSSTTLNSLGTDSGDTICNNTACDNYTGLRILPNVTSLRYNRISNFFNASRFMESSGNPFGLNASTVDSHMMKNSEWGAVAYLSHSRYGINDDVRRNNQNTFTTGCGGLTADAGSIATCNNAYETVTTYLQSTTGNVTGVFDMSGGAWEYVMGHYGTTSTYGTTSGFSSAYPLPDTKYYNNYDSTQFKGFYDTNFNFCTLSTCGGYALNETKGWYFGEQVFVVSSQMWFERGGANDSFSSPFSVNKSDGSPYDYLSFRMVLTADNE